MSDNTGMIEKIVKCDDPDKLRTWIKNARFQNAMDVADAAFRQLISIIPSEQPGTVEHDFWQTINAFEFVLSDERHRTTGLRVGFASHAARANLRTRSMTEAA